MRASVGTGRYRWRTALRRRLPFALNGLAPKGARDCGRHEWYRQDGTTWRCYHCEAGVRHDDPWVPVAEALAPVLAEVGATAAWQALDDDERTAWAAWLLDYPAGEPARRYELARRILAGERTPPAYPWWRRLRDGAVVVVAALGP